MQTNKTGAEEFIHLHYDIVGDDFDKAGQAAASVKKRLRELGFSADLIRRVSIAMYEAEINVVIHAEQGEADVFIYPDQVRIVMADRGKGIPDLEKAMTAGWSTATDQARELGFGAGMGLPNIKKYSDELNIQSTVGVGTTLNIVVRA